MGPLVVVLIIEFIGAVQTASVVYINRDSKIHVIDGFDIVDSASEPRCWFGALRSLFQVPWEKDGLNFYFIQYGAEHISINYQKKHIYSYHKLLIYSLYKEIRLK